MPPKKTGKTTGSGPGDPGGMSKYSSASKSKTKLATPSRKVSFNPPVVGPGRAKHIVDRDLCDTAQHQACESSPPVGQPPSKNCSSRRKATPAPKPQPQPKKPTPVISDSSSDHSSETGSRQPSATNSPLSSRDPSPAPTSRVLIRNHVAGANNPFHLARVMASAKLRMPCPTNNFAHKTHTTTLIFSSPRDACAFVNAIPASPTFGTTAAYVLEPRPQPKPKQPASSRAPLLHVVVRGVHQEIGEEELMSAGVPPGSCAHGRDFVRAKRIVDREGRPTGLVRLFTACQDCCAGLLKHGLTVYGRTYRCESPRTVLIRPCGRCHDYGHASSSCRAQARCRVCGDPLNRGSPCTHPDHNLDVPFCATCNKPGHYTGQQQCPMYPHDQALSVPTRFIPDRPSVPNPWDLKREDFPPLTETTPPVLEPQHSGPEPECPEQDPVAPPSSDQPQIASDAADPQYVTVDALNSLLDKLLTVISDGFQRTFDALINIMFQRTPTLFRQGFFDEVNTLTKRAFDRRTILQTLDTGIKLLHTPTKKPNRSKT